MGFPHDNLRPNKNIIDQTAWINDLHQIILREL